MTPTEVIKYAQKHGAQFIDCKFIDFPGMWQHITFPIWRLTEEAFEEGFGFDGSSIRGWAAINSSDMLMLPDPTTAMMDPFLTVPTISFICSAKPAHQSALIVSCAASSAAFASAGLSGRRRRKTGKLAKNSTIVSAMAKNQKNSQPGTIGSKPTGAAFSFVSALSA